MHLSGAALLEQNRGHRAVARGGLCKLCILLVVVQRRDSRYKTAPGSLHAQEGLCFSCRPLLASTLPSLPTHSAKQVASVAKLRWLPLQGCMYSAVGRSGQRGPRSMTPLWLSRRREPRRTGLMSHTPCIRQTTVSAASVPQYSCTRPSSTPRSRGPWCSALGTPAHPLRRLTRELATM